MNCMLHASRIGILLRPAIWARRKNNTSVSKTRNDHNHMLVFLWCYHDVPDVLTRMQFCPPMITSLAVLASVMDPLIVCSQTLQELWIWIGWMMWMCFAATACCCAVMSAKGLRELSQSWTSSIKKWKSATSLPGNWTAPRLHKITDGCASVKNAMGLQNLPCSLFVTTGFQQPSSYSTVVSLW